jgi:hypothetical protein
MLSPLDVSGYPHDSRPASAPPLAFAHPSLIFFPSPEGSCSYLPLMPLWLLSHTSRTFFRVVAGGLLLRRRIRSRLGDLSYGRGTPIRRDGGGAH